MPEDKNIILFESKNDAFKILAEREMKTISVGKIRYGILRFNQDIFVFDIECPHAGYDLTTGKVSPAGLIICPWHNYQFAVSKGNELEDRCKHLTIQKAHFNKESNLCFTAWK